ncbi:penicillin-binding protein [Nocardioides sp. zg-536]|uniref:Beta-lactamase n=1 Tax=Nocardioides faecalis TaxID=2803858 RepID=A0A939BXE6_9ACTN|nr:penicillin-binding transpeptidase domain-containing protein [Nocardioides faecalis]MBM9458740.1 penicillin-binding protein [Nocardioides faecalis]QVI58724.1 penicillin-binding protein [Nocardioides faecalis]
MRRISAPSHLLGLVLALTAGALVACDSQGSEEDAAQALAEQLVGALTAHTAPPEPAATSDSAVAEASPAAPSESLSEPESESEASSPLADVPFVDAEGKPVESSAVTEEVDEVLAGMDGLVPTVELAGGVRLAGDEDDGGDGGDEAERTAAATLTWSWPDTDEGAWRYDADVSLVRSGQGWAVTWERALLEPGLEPGDVLDAVTQPADRGDITGAGGEVLVTERRVVRIGIDRSKVSAAAAPTSARRLARLADLDADRYATAVKAAGPRAFVEAITYRDGEVPARVEAAISTVPGVAGVVDDVPLAPSRDFAAPILGRVGPVTAEMVEKDPQTYRPGQLAGLSGVQSRYDEQLRGRDGRIVYAVPEDGAEKRRTLYEREPEAGRPLALTLDRNLQALAEKVLSATGPASALVAVRPSDGAILAAANDAGTDGRNDATFGRFAPGSTFKIVTALALSRAGLEPSSPVRCTPTITVDGKRFKNYSDYPASALGRITLAEAFAQSCNTALIGERERIGKNDLAEAAASLGLGIDHDLGFPAFFGEVPDAASDTEAAAALIGQGKILASPMAMATVMASVQAGRTVVPRLVDQVDVSVPAAAKPLSDDEAATLRQLTRGVVTEGSGRVLAGVPGGAVRAKTGTAEYAEEGAIRTHAWMVAARDDLAVAVFVRTGKSGSATAGPLLRGFLYGAP